MATVTDKTVPVTQVSGSEDERSHSMSDGTSTPTKTGMIPKLKRHLAKWWWLHLLIGIVITVVIVVLIIFVAIRAIAQKGYDASTVETQYQALRDPTPESFFMDLDLFLQSGSSFHPRVDGFNASFYLEDTEPNIKPFAFVQFPDFTANAEWTINISQKVEIVDMEEFSRFNKFVVINETFRVAVYGKTKLHLPGLPTYSVTNRKVTEIKGFNKLQGFSLSNSVLHNPPLSDGAVVTSQVTIPNPTILAIDMGNITVSLYARDGTYLGYSLVSNLTLDAHSNKTYEARSYVDTAKVPAFLENGMLHLRVVGNTSVNAAGQRIPYLEAALKANEIEYDINIIELVQNSQSLTQGQNGTQTASQNNTMV